MDLFQAKSRRRTKKRRYNKKSRRFTSKRKTTRKHFKRQNKKGSRNMKGGEVFRGSDQGCAFWPSVWPQERIDDQTTVTKIFFTVGAALGLQNEVAGYGIFHKYDPNNIFHARLKEHGDCLTNVAMDNGCERGYTRNKETKYINTEYVGTSLKYGQVRKKQFKLDLISFFIGLLSLSIEGSCLIFPDLNGGNICYMYNEVTNQYIFKCIDVGGVFELSASQPVEETKIGDIHNQFINIRSLLLQGLQNFAMPVFAYVANITYENNLASEIQKLRDALNYVTATDETLLFPNKNPLNEDVPSKPEKKSKYSSEKLPTFSMFHRDESPPSSGFNLGPPSGSLFGSDSEED